MKTKLLLLVLMFSLAAHAGLEEVVVDRYLKSSPSLLELQRAAQGDVRAARKIIDERFFPNINQVFEQTFPKDNSALHDRAYVHVAKILLRTEVEGLRHHAAYLEELHKLVAQCDAPKKIFNNPGQAFPCQQELECSGEAGRALKVFLQQGQSEEQAKGFARELMNSEISFEGYTIDASQRLMSSNYAFRGVNYFAPIYPPMNNDGSNGSTLISTSSVLSGITTLRQVKCRLTDKGGANCKVIVGNNEQVIAGAKDVACGGGDVAPVTLQLPWVNQTDRSLGPKLETTSREWNEGLPRASRGRAE